RLSQSSLTRTRSETCYRIDRQFVLPYDVVAMSPPRREDAGPAKVKKKRRAELAEPTPEQVADVARRTARRVADALRKAGKSLTPEFDTDHEDTDAFAESQAALALCYASAARGVDITGERAGQPSLRHPSASSTRTSFSEASPPPSCRESMCTLPPLSTGAIENASRDSAVTSPGPPSPRTASSRPPTAGCTPP